MDFPVHVSFRNLEICDTIEGLCWEQAALLEAWSDRIDACRVTITSRPGESPPLRVQVELLLGQERMKTSEEPSSPGAVAIELAVRDAFATLRRRLRGADWLTPTIRRWSASREARAS